MRKVFVFGGDNYYPKGGMSDFVQSFTTFEEAQTYVNNNIVGVSVTKIPIGKNGAFYTKQTEKYTWGDWVQIIDISEKL
jgi:hypothetical protein